MIINLLGAGLVLGISAFILRSFGWRGAPVFAVICSVVLIAEAADGLGGIFSSIGFLYKQKGLDSAVRAALKVLGLGYLFGISSDVCRELGEAGIAKSLEVVGRVEIIAVIVPFLKEIVETGVELIG